MRVIYVVDVSGPNGEVASICDWVNWLYSLLSELILIQLRYCAFWVKRSEDGCTNELGIKVAEVQIKYCISLYVIEHDEAYDI